MLTLVECVWFAEKFSTEGAHTGWDGPKYGLFHEDVLEAEQEQTIQ